MKIERYKNNNKGEKWVRIKFMNAAKTEVIMPEKEFVKSMENFIDILVAIMYNKVYNALE